MAAKDQRRQRAWLFAAMARERVRLLGFECPPPSCLQKMAHLGLSSIPQVDPSDLWIKPMYS